MWKDMPYFENKAKPLFLNENIPNLVRLLLTAISNEFGAGLEFWASLRLVYIQADLIDPRKFIRSY